jgi:uncharacterized protein YbjQ (UPF0145 family)
VALTSTQAYIPGYVVTAYKGIVQGETWGELLRQAEKTGANAILNTCFDDALDVDTLFHGSAVVVKRVHPPGKPIRRPRRRKLSRQARRAQ